MKQKEFELLAPAGDKDSFIAACQNVPMLFIWESVNLTQGPWLKTLA